MGMSRQRASKGVRIIGGKWRGRRVSVPERASVRPTPDRVRETLFNWLTDMLPGARCLDLFAGTGVLGLEALSRGAAEAWLIERDPLLVQALRELAATLGSDARIVQGDALQILSQPPAEPFDVVFADPPYAMDLGGILRRLPAWVGHEHLIYVERNAPVGAPAAADLTGSLPGAAVRKQGRAGRVRYGLLTLQK